MAEQLQYEGDTGDVVDADGVVVATVYVRSGGRDAEQRAHAFGRLFAAAPEMAELLERATSALGLLDDGLGRARTILRSLRTEEAPRG